MRIRLSFCVITTRRRRGALVVTVERLARMAKAMVPGVHAMVAVASGKGGVGRSTNAVNLALVAEGHRDAKLDSDIYDKMLRFPGFRA